MNYHPDHDLPHDAEKVDESVEITVDQSVVEHRDHKPLGDAPDGHSDAAEDLGQQSRCVAETLAEPCPAPSDAPVDDGLGIMAASVKGRWQEAGKASRKGDAGYGKTISKTSSRGLENRAMPNPPPGTIPQNHDEIVGKSFKPRSSMRLCYTMLLHNGALHSPVSSGNGRKKSRLGCYTKLDSFKLSIVD